MSIINFTNTLPVQPTRWAARFLSISWAFWALFWAWFVVAHFTEAKNPFSLAVSATVMIVFALMFMGAAIVASVWGKEAFGGRALLVDGMLMIAAIVVVAYLTGSPREFFRLPWLNALVFCTMVLPPLVAGSLFLISASATASSSAEPKVVGAKAVAEEPDRPEGRTATLRKKIAISLLLLSLVAVFVFDVALYPQPKIAPPKALVGTWEAEAYVRVGRLPVRFTLHEDGRVKGTVGDAAMQDAYFRRNRGWLLGMLGWATEYIVKGDLKGPLTGDFQCARFWIVGQFDENGISSVFDCSGCQKDGKKEAPLGNIVGAYTRVKQP